MKRFYSGLMVMEKVGKYVSQDFFILDPSDSLAKARNPMFIKKTGTLVVVDGKEKVLVMMSRSDMAFAQGKGSSKLRKKESSP